jgi:parallel beta-helix repeat protein
VRTQETRLRVDGRVERRTGGLLRLVTASALVAATCGAPSVLADGSPTTLYVAPGGSDAAACSPTAPCATIGHAVAVAPASSTIIVRAGTYAEQVTVTKPLTLLGQGLPTIDATGQSNGILVQGPGAAGTVIAGFQVTNAQMEGILLLGTSNVTVRGNVVFHNDLGASAPQPVGECAPVGEIPGDCGEGIHLMGTSQSSVVGNLVSGNLGGILLSDEVGPTANNLVAENVVVNNAPDCGITLAGHNPKAVAGGTRQPGQAGVYGNVVTGNISESNGEGGVLIGAALPGAGVYDNVISYNGLADDGLAGVTIHSHTPNQDVHGNQILFNDITHTAISGGANGSPGDVDAGLSGTAGIVIASEVVPVRNVVINGNVLSDVRYGIWTKNAKSLSLGVNSFAASVDVPVVNQ